MIIHFSEESLRELIADCIERYELAIENGTEPHIAADRVENHALYAIIRIGNETLH